MAAELLRAHAAAIAALANSPRRDRGASRALYSYPAKFQAHLPAELIRLFSRPGDLVVDPYCGGGTTGLEAFLLGRAFFGVDLSPFACLVARVKTTRLPAGEAQAALEALLASRHERAILDDEDAGCLGPRIAGEVHRLAGGLDALAASPPVVDFLRLAVLHALKIAGRRDFDGDSLVPLLSRRVQRMLPALAALPEAGPRPRYRCGPNREMPELDGGAASLVVTSPPYKDLDVEYGLLQIQRPRLNKSKRSRAIWALLGVPALPKTVLCGGRGEAYWEALAPSLREIRRVLAPGAPSFFWTGFKSAADQARFERHLAEAGLPVERAIRVHLGRDRVASSRSTHHRRPTGMLGHDYLFACG